MEELKKRLPLFTRSNVPLAEYKNTSVYTNLKIYIMGDDTVYVDYVARNSNDLIGHFLSKFQLSNLFKVIVVTYDVKNYLAIIEPVESTEFKTQIMNNLAQYELLNSGAFICKSEDHLFSKYLSVVKDLLDESVLDPKFFELKKMLNHPYIKC